MKYDRSLEEVWEWKEKTYQDSKDLTALEYLVKIECDAKQLMHKYGVSLRNVKRESPRLAA